MADPEVYLNALGSDLGETMGNSIAESYKLMAAIKPDAVLVTDAFPLSVPSACISPFSIWKQATVARRRVGEVV